MHRLGEIPRILALCAVCLAGLIVLFLAAQAASLALVKDKSIIAHLRASVAAGVITAQDFPTSAYGHAGLNNDKFTDCLAISTNLGNEDRSLLYRVTAMPYVLTPREGLPQSPCAMLVKDVQERRMHPDIPYFRYWHGHQIYLRPMLSGMTLDRVHVCNAMLLVFSLAFMIAQLMRRFGAMAAPVVLIPLMTNTHILTTPTSTVHALSWITAFMSIGVMARWLENRPASAQTTAVLAFALGCVGAFFDLLFSPPFVPTFIAFLALSAAARQTARRDGVHDGLYDAMQLAFVWFLGFGLTWISKWVLATAVFSVPDVIANLTDAIGRRSFGDDSISQGRTMFSATAAALTALRAEVIAWGAAVAVLIGGIAAATGKLGWRIVGLTALTLTPLLIPVVWVEVLRDHTIVHPNFAARSFILFAILPMLAALSLHEQPQYKLPAAG